MTQHWLTVDTVTKDPKEAVYSLWALACKLGCGVQSTIRFRGRCDVVVLASPEADARVLYEDYLRVSEPDFRGARVAVGIKEAA